MPGSVVTTRAWPALGPLPTPPTQTISTSTLALLLTTLPVPPPSSVGVLLASAGESDAAWHSSLRSYLFYLRDPNGLLGRTRGRERTFRA